MNYGFEIVCASVFTFFCIISARFYSLINRAYTYWDKKKINGPLPRYIIGTWSGFAEKFLGSDDYANALKYGKVYGTYDGLTPNLLVTDPEMIKKIVANSSEKLQDSRFISESSVVLKDSLLSLSAGEKLEIRNLTNSLLEPRKLEKLIPKLILSAETLIRDITKARQEDGLVNATSCVAEFIDETIALTIFGIELNADVQFKDEFVKSTRHIFLAKSPQSIWSLLPFLYENYFKDAWVCPEKALQHFVNLLITGISASSSEAILNEGKASNLIELMVEAAHEEKKLVPKSKEDENPSLVLTDNTIISKCIASVISLARITKTTVLLGIYALANDEEVQEKLYKEIAEAKNASGVISYDSTQNMNYLDKVVKEILRLYPFDFRLEKVVTDNVKLGDVDLDKKVRVSVPLYALHRLEEFYPDPQKFDPERFSQSVSEKRNPYAYLPFGQAGFNGSDISLQLGILASKITLFKLIETFKFSSTQQLGLHRLFQKGYTKVPQPDKIEVFAETRN